MRKSTSHATTIAAFVAIVAAFFAGCSTHSAPVHAATPQLVYICQQQPCANAQEFEVFDQYGNPVASVGEYSGLGAYGAPIMDYAPGNVNYAAVSTSWEGPNAYAADTNQPDTCTGNGIWIAPAAIWKCNGSTWTQALKF